MGSEWLRSGRVDWVSVKLVLLSMIWWLASAEDKAACGGFVLDERWQIKGGLIFIGLS
jgi:hypothetical protein